MANAYDCSEQRQHINLSLSAYETLSEDLLLFASRLKTISGYINLILEEYTDESTASISLAIERQRELFSNIISTQKKRIHGSDALTPDESRIINYLLQDYTENLIKRAKSFPKEKTLKIRLQNDVYKLFYPDLPESKYYEIAGDYIKAILEDFASLPVIDRERIVFGDVYGSIISELRNSDLSSRTLLRVTYIPAYSEKEIKFRVKPYSLTTDSESQFHYLVGLSKPHDSATAKYSPAVFRLSRIKKVVEDKSSGSGRITKDEKKLIEATIRSKGIQFLHANDDNYVVKLTPAGINKYNSISHLRPVADSSLTEIDDNGDTIMHFHCTSMQIYNYFFKFGADATIISPESLADRFRKEYIAASQNYI